MDTYKLKQPRKIDGVEITEIHYDLDNLSGMDLIGARTEAEKRGHVIMIQETDPALHMALFARAAEPKMHLDDISLLSAADCMAICARVRTYFIEGSEDGSV